MSSKYKNVFMVAGLQCTFWFAMSIANYQTVYLQEGGVSASSLGVLNSISSFVGIFAVMFWGMISDRINSIKKTLMISLGLGAALFAVIPFLPAKWKFATIMFMVYCPFVNFFRCAGSTLLDNLTIRNCNALGLNYGPARATGSFMYTVGCFSATALVTAFSVKCSFWVSGLLVILPMVMLIFTNDPKLDVKIDSKGKVNINPKELLKNYYYIAFLIFVVLSFIPLNAEYCFLTYLMQEKGLPLENFGIFTGVRALMEVPFLILVVKLRRRFKLKYLIMTAVTLMGTECILLSLFANTFPRLLLCGAVFGLGNGLFVGTVAAYVYKLAPDNLKASAQSIYASVGSAAGIASNFIGGFIFQKIGGAKFYMILGFLCFFSVIFFAVSFMFAKGKENPGDVLD